MQIKTTRYHLPLVRMAIIKKRMARMWWKGNTHCWCKCKLVRPLWKTIWRFLKKLKTELPHIQQFHLWEYNQKKWNRYSVRAASQCFLWHNSQQARNGNNPNAKEPMNGYSKIWYIYTVEYYLATRKEDILPIKTAQNDPQHTVCAKWDKPERETSKYYKVPLTCGI